MCRSKGICDRITHAANPTTDKRTSHLQWNQQQGIAGRCRCLSAGVHCLGARLQCHPCRALRIYRGLQAHNPALLLHSAIADPHESARFWKWRSANCRGISLGSGFQHQGHHSCTFACNRTDLLRCIVVVLPITREFRGWLPDWTTIAEHQLYPSRNLGFLGRIMLLFNVFPHAAENRSGGKGIGALRPLS